MPWNPNQAQEFGLILLAMGELFETPVSFERAELFVRAVEDMEFEAVKAAASTYSRTGTFFPKPVNIRDLVEGNVEDRAERAWELIRREIRRVGYYGKPAWPDEVTQHAAEGLFGGWRALCESLPADGPELLGYRKQFIASFGAAARQAAAGELGPGRAEASALLDDLNKQLHARGLPSGKPR